MSVWKNVAKANRRTPRERHQPESREHLGILEKKKDYVVRAKDFNEKKKTLQLLEKRALNRNPDEFNHHMINANVRKGVHFEKAVDEDEHTADQVKLMQTQDLKYITFKRTQELRKIERLQAQLHLIGVQHDVKNKHIVFKKNLEQDDDAFEPNLMRNVSDIDVAQLKRAVHERKALYKQLAKRIKREKELSIIQQKLEIKRHIDEKKTLLKPERIKRGTKHSAPVYKWKYERKR